MPKTAHFSLFFAGFFIFDWLSIARSLFHNISELIMITKGVDMVQFQRCILMVADAAGGELPLILSALETRLS